MMDFDDAAARLAKDQSKMRGRTSISISDKAKKQAEQQRQQQARLRAERERKRRLEEYRGRVIRTWGRKLKEQALGPPGATGGTNRAPLLLTPTSIHGDGDKIALPTSVLETLMTSPNSNGGGDPAGGGGGGNPWTFRIGILNPDYKFPSSPLVRALMPPREGDGDDHVMDGVESDDDDDDEAGKHEQGEAAAFRDELGHKYLSYTHCTVVEFTQEEGYVGIPQHIASSLLDPKNRHPTLRSCEIPTTRTVDPASRGGVSDSQAGGGGGDETMDDDPTGSTVAAATEADGDKTPGHLAWGAFDVPVGTVEITMVRLPKGRGCTLVPTQQAVRNNFYGLMDVKLVLEQSLTRTRATLSGGDVVSTWHRGVRYDLDVTQVTPSTFGAVTCINTDIEVEIGETSMQEADGPQQERPLQTESAGPPGFAIGSGQALSSTTSFMPVVPNHEQPTRIIDLLPEPPADQREGVCAVQIRFSGGHGKRRFAVHTAKVRDLFAFASSLMDGRNEGTFRLVTRFPRRELIAGSSDGGAPFGSTNPALQTLAEAGVESGQELFLVENL
jgi:Ubiquitin fusion degradation protein UFD1/UBX domain